MLKRITVRWQIAAACAGLTFLILVCFALVLGNLVGNRIRNDRAQELSDAASAFAAETFVGSDPLSGPFIRNSPRLADFAMADDAVIRVVDSHGRLWTSGAGAGRDVDLGPPSPGVKERGDFSVASHPVAISTAGPAYVQYARPAANVEHTIARLWLFLGAGVLGGTALALLAGFGVADRAMRPIASMTALARDITTTRDPSKRLPVRAADDEIGELASTLEGMLAALDEARSERERSFDRQREFVADASHELRTPLTSIQANLELLQASLERDGDDRQAVDSALGSTKRMSRLVSDLLLLARADAGRSATRAELDLAEVAGDAREEVLPLARKRAVKAAIEGPVPVDGNSDELHRLALNLLENAVRHTPDGSTIELSVRRDGGRALLEVSDDGPGIPEDKREQVFERFVRGAGPADTSASGGSGLGLAIVRAVAERHGGSVEASEAPGGGARLTVTMPLSPGAGARRRVEQPAASSR